MSKNTKDRIKEIYDPEIYTKISLDHLITFCVRSILDSGEECTFERLVYEAFTNFPKKFGLLRYPNWPDSARVNKSWLRCRTDFGYIVGSAKEGFRLTEQGKRIAENAKRRLVETKIQQKDGIFSHDSGKTREKYEAVLKQIRINPLFQSYINDPINNEFDEMKLRLLLNCTMETPIRVLRQNIKYFINIAKTYGDSEVIKFLNKCENAIRKMR